MSAESAARDCRFIASDNGTVHERREWPGEEHDYEFHPKCGQRLPPGSKWSRVPAESKDDLRERWDLRPCTKCFNSWRWLEGEQ